MQMRSTCPQNPLKPFFRPFYPQDTETFISFLPVLNSMPLNLEKIVVYPTWREMLMDVMVKESIDPWDIDLVKLTSKYIEYVRDMKDLELHIPANIILAASILLRMKSEVLKIEEASQDIQPEVYLDDGAIEEVPILELKARIPPKRRVTLDELISAMGDAFKKETDRAARLTNTSAPSQPREIFLDPGLDLDTLTSQLYSRMDEKFDRKGMLTFSSIFNGNGKDKGGKDMDGKDKCGKDNDEGGPKGASDSNGHANPDEKVKVFLPMLYLANRGELVLIQDKLFGEIIVARTPKYKKDFKKEAEKGGKDLAKVKSVKGKGKKGESNN